MAARTLDIAAQTVDLEALCQADVELERHVALDTEQFWVISEVGRRLASILDINALLHEIVQLIQGSFGYDHVGLALIEGDRAVYRVGAGKLWADPAFTFAPNSLCVNGYSPTWC